MYKMSCVKLSFIKCSSTYTHFHKIVTQSENTNPQHEPQNVIEFSSEVFSNVHGTQETTNGGCDAEHRCFCQGLWPPGGFLGFDVGRCIGCDCPCTDDV